MYAYASVYTDVFARIRQRGHDVQHILPAEITHYPVITMSLQNNNDILVTQSEKKTQIEIAFYDKALEQELLVELMEDVLGELLRVGHEQMPWPITQCKMRMDYQSLNKTAVIVGRLTIEVPLTKRSA